MATFEERLVKLRKEKKMTQGELAKAIDISTDTVKSIESGRRNPSIKLTSKLADYFGVKHDYLIGDDFFREDYAHSYEAFWNDEELVEVLTDDIKRLRMDERIAIFNYIQDLKANRPEAFVQEVDNGVDILISRARSED